MLFDRYHKYKIKVERLVIIDLFLFEKSKFLSTKYILYIKKLCNEGF